MKMYDAIRFHQYISNKKSDELILFAARARDISNWAGIPRKGWQIRMLFQRPITKARETQLKKFWTQAATPKDGDEYILGPTAIIVASQGEAKINEKGQIDLSYSCPVDILAEPSVVISDLALRLFPDVKKRLSDKQVFMLENREATGNAFSPFPEIDNDYVFEFALQMQQMICDAKQFIQENSISDESVREIITSMEAVLRPAIVVDGQHRLHGASNVGSEILLPVVAIPHCPWPEQIYQFVVINEKAQRVDASLLSDIFGSSLTNSEQEYLRNKLDKSDVEIESRIASVMANRESTSPFKNMIMVKMDGKMPEGLDPFISERTIRALIEGTSQKYSWGWRAHDDFYDKYVHPTFSTRQSWDSWVNGKWIEYWFAFWDEVRIFYNLSSDPKKGAKTKLPEPLWSHNKQTNLTKAITLRQLQTLFMQYCIERMEEIEKSRDVLLRVLKDHDTVETQLQQQFTENAIPSDIQAFRRFVREEFLEKGIEEKVFRANWKTSLDDASGHDELWEVLSGAFTKHRKGESYYVGGKIFVVKDKKA
jgi:hypothetical protein